MSFEMFPALLTEAASVHRKVEREVPTRREAKRQAGRHTGRPTPGAPLPEGWETRRHSGISSGSRSLSHLIGT